MKRSTYHTLQNDKLNLLSHKISTMLSKYECYVDIQQEAKLTMQTKPTLQVYPANLDEWISGH